MIRVRAVAARNIKSVMGCEDKQKSPAQKGARAVRF